MAKRTPVGTVGKGRRGISVLGWALRGAAAGAAGTTALNAVTYLDMVVRGRGTSSTPEQTVEKLADVAHVQVPGDDDTKQNREQGLGPLTGIAAGVGAGALYALLVRGRRPSLPVGAGIASVLALLAGNAPMTLLGVTDPRTWPLSSWVSDVVPHAAYGVVAAATLNALED
jgi:hypothetical protein